MKKVFAALLCILLFAGMCACGKAEVPAEENETTITTVYTTTAATEATTEMQTEPPTQEPVTLDPNRPMAIMEPVQGGLMLYTFIGRNGKLGLINQDGKLVAAPQYEPPNIYNYSAEYIMDAKYTYGTNGRIDGMTVQKGERGESFVHYTLDGKSRPVEGHQEYIEKNTDADKGIYSRKNERMATILDADKNLLYTIKPGEKIVVLYPVPYELRMMGLVVQDAEGRVVKAVDQYGRPMQSKAEAQFFMDEFNSGFFKLQNGEWTALNLRQFIDRNREAHAAYAMVVTEDWLIVATGVSYTSMAVEEVFAVDWNGKQYKNCPLAPFMSKDGFPCAGEQGPDYFWVEHKGKRGYINTKGEWLFVDQS